MSYPCQREELDEEMKLKQKENAFKMHNIFNKQDVIAQIHKQIIPKSKAKRLQQNSMKNPGVGNNKTLTNDPKGNLKLFDVKTKITDEKDYAGEQGETKSTRNVLYCNNNKCHRIIKNIDGNFYFNLNFFLNFIFNYFYNLGEIHLESIFDRDINAAENIMHIWKSDVILAVFVKRGSR